MKTSHHVDGPGGTRLSGPRDLTAFFANDNQARFPVAAAGACGLVLAAETGKNWTSNEDQDVPFVTIRLLAEDGSLSEPVHATREQRDIIALWRGLGRDFNLPLFLQDVSGAMTPIAPRAGECVFAHRRGSALSGRRPRFLTRRQVPMAPFNPGRKRSGARRKG